MIRNMLYFGVTVALLIAFAWESNSFDFSSLADQSSLRCSGGVISVEGSDRDVYVLP